MDEVRVVVPRRLTADSLAALDEAMAEGLRRPEARALVLEGERGAFCEGLDLDGVRDGAPDPVDGRGLPAALLAFAEQLTRVRRCPLPTVAVVRGAALGGGLGLAAACDVVLAEEQARFGLPEVLVGLNPAIVFPFLAERATPQAVRRLALLGSTIGAPEALTMGLVDEVAAEGALEVCLSRWVRDLSRGAPHAVARLKGAEPDRPDIRDEARAGALVTLELLRHPLTRAAIRAHIDGDVPWRRP